MPARHDLIWLTTDGWAQALTSAGLDGIALARAVDWRDRGLPGVVRRREPDLPLDAVCVGLPFPPDPVDGHKLRVALTVDAGGIARARAPLALNEVEAPVAWRDAFAALSASMRSAGIDCRVFGSLAMQTLTGNAYVRAGSDIDVLLRPATMGQLDAGLALLVRHAGMLPLDGEVVFPSGHAVAWKEWAMAGGDADRVLTKHVDAVALMRRDALAGQFAEVVHA